MSRKDELELANGILGKLDNLISWMSNIDLLKQQLNNLLYLLDQDCSQFPNVQSDYNYEPVVTPTSQQQTPQQQTQETTTQNDVPVVPSQQYKPQQQQDVIPQQTSTDQPVAPSSQDLQPTPTQEQPSTPKEQYIPSQQQTSTDQPLAPSPQDLQSTSTPEQSSTTPNEQTTPSQTPAQQQTYTDQPSAPSPQDLQPTPTQEQIPQTEEQTGPAPIPVQQQTDTDQTNNSSTQNLNPHADQEVVPQQQQTTEQQQNYSSSANLTNQTQSSVKNYTFKPSLEYMQAQILIQGHENLDITYTSDNKTFQNVGTSSSWEEVISTTLKVQRGGFFLIKVASYNGIGGFVGKIVLDGVTYLTNVDNFQPVKGQYDATQMNQYDNTDYELIDNITSLKIDGAYWLWPAIDTIGEFTFKFVVPRKCADSDFNFYGKCFINYPLQFSKSLYYGDETHIDEMLSPSKMYPMSVSPIIGAFTQRPINDQELFGINIPAIDSSNDVSLALGLCLKESNFQDILSDLDNKSPLFDNNQFVFGFLNYDQTFIVNGILNRTELQDYCVEEYSINDQDLWIQYFESSNQIAFYTPTCEPILLDLPEIFIGRRLYPCVNAYENYPLTIASQSSKPTNLFTYIDE